MRVLEAWMADDQVTDAANIAIRGLDGGRCVSSVRSALSLIRGVQTVEISLESGHATVYFDPEKAHPSQFPVAVQAVGFEAQLVTPEPA